MINEFSKLIVLNRRLEPIADLENAFDLTEDERINTIGHMQFALPYNDHKNQYCEPFNYVRNPGGELYRIMMDSKTITETGDWEYRVEHVFSTLADKTIQRPIVLGGVGAQGTTAAVLKHLLNMQDVRNWVLGECDFNFNFEYGFLGESLLSSILDVPHHFVEPFQWTFDTSRHPFVLNLKRLTPNADPEIYIETGKNRIKAVRHRDQTTVCTRLYPYGYGEYPNRLTIESVNNGVEFLQSPPEIFNRYPNAIERTFVDRRIQNPQSLLEIGQAILNEAQVPFEEYEVELTELGGDPFSTPALGKLAEMVGFKRALITGIKWEHKEIPKCTVTLANRPRNIADEVLQLRNRVRIESTYAQGVTQFWQAHKSENATPQRAASLPLFIPGSMRVINFVTVNIEVRPFEIPIAGRQTELAGAGVWTSSGPSMANSGNANANITVGQHTGNSGNASANITINQHAGNTSGATASITNMQHPGFSGTEASNVAGRVGSAHNHGIPDSTVVNTGSTTRTFLESGAHSHPSRGILFSQSAHAHGINHNHTITQTTHSHAMSHGHAVSQTAHSHTIAHTHTTETPTHRHLLEPGIAPIGNPTSFVLRINGQNHQTVQGRQLQRDIRQFMTGQDGQINTNFMHRIEVLPNAPAHVSITIFVQGFLMAERELVL